MAFFAEAVFGTNGLQNSKKSGYWETGRLGPPRVDVKAAQRLVTLVALTPPIATASFRAVRDPPAAAPQHVDTLQNILFVAPVLLFSVIAHEYAHGYAALKQGDPTAQSLGRLTWNPVSTSIPT